MEAQAFWEVIGAYNSATWWASFAFLTLLLAALLISYTTKIHFAIKCALGLFHLFIGIVFFGIFGTEPIQKFFALPLFISCGILFFYEAISNHDDKPRKPNFFQIVLLSLYALYPACSYMLGHRFPHIVTYSMPCPVVCLGLSAYALYPRKNKVLLLLLTVWGLTGVKAIFFDAYEDMILLVCGIYGVLLLRKELLLPRISVRDKETA
ncbi:hypothetical protein SpiGrapes_2771 [Sphaerochaeta pleomorpha str. Grapes]|uniref:Uncharacterized protein n=1 Tax=Sphaerochaeta pleomorpha (strain ATCC BAA-1885 / DSM 22778 / Grapes) TaxID=158190 RepID=G8QW04_SPHPG|nr:DUF6064 family protein [Sphaerochaeta pleomorpha]AEV30528.1 hypothetical protein SpiGrapes_2771 [Sphaerochaeta pleomorpha str. Grapes]